MRTIGHGLLEVIDALSIPYVIGLGEGAGANILARFGMDYPQRSLGLILIHCTSTVAGVMEYFRDKVNPLSLRVGALNSTTIFRPVFSRHIKAMANINNGFIRKERGGGE